MNTVPSSQLSVPHCKQAGEGNDLLPMVFLHGIGGDCHSFDASLAHFSPMRRVIAWDMPGYGRSEALPEMTFSSLTAALDRLTEHLGIPEFILVGHSMGGMVAQDYVATYPDKVPLMVLSGTSPAFGKPGGEWQKKFLAERLKPLDDGKVPDDFAGPVVAGMLGDFATDEILDAAKASMSRLSAASYRQALTCIVQFDRRADLANIACPTLLLAAEKDGNAPPMVMERMAEKIAHSHYHCLSGVGHLANFERPDLFNAAIDDFLAANRAIDRQ